MMKSIFTSLRQSILCAFSLFLFSPFLTFAQHSESPDPVESAVVSSPIQADFSAYLPVVTHRNEWIVEYSFPTFPNEIRRFSFAGDSVLQGTQYYHELVYTGTSGPANWLSTGQFFREVNGRVWKYSEGFAGNEQLIYDMDFAIGDTLLSTADGQQTRTVNAVGTTVLADGIPRKNLTISSICGESNWIEGIGDIERLFWSEIFCSLVDQDGLSQTICSFSTDGQFLYHQSGADICISSTNEPSVEVMRVYPNPAASILYFDLKDGEMISDIQLFNAAGVPVTFKPGNLHQQSMDITTLAPGFYSGMVYLRQNQVKVFKIVVE